MCVKYLHFCARETRVIVCPRVCICAIYFSHQCNNTRELYSTYNALRLLLRLTFSAAIINLTIEGQFSDMAKLLTDLSLVAQDANGPIMAQTFTPRTQLAHHGARSKSING